jgi:hypothetical protein
MIDHGHSHTYLKAQHTQCETTSCLMLMRSLLTYRQVMTSMIIIWPIAQKKAGGQLNCKRQTDLSFEEVTMQCMLC